MNNAELKQKARAQLGGKIFGTGWLCAVLVMLLQSAVVGIGNRGRGVGLAVLLLVGGPLSCSAARMFLKQSADGRPMDLHDLAAGFTEDFSGSFLLNLMQSIFIVLWSLLLVVPGIVKALGWSMSFYVRAEHPDYTWRQCLDASAALTGGYKGEIFLLHLSFIGWYIVGALCLGVGTLWVQAYVQATMTQCYHWLKAQQSYSTDEA